MSLFLFTSKKEYNYKILIIVKLANQCDQNLKMPKVVIVAKMVKIIFKMAQTIKGARNGENFDW